MQLESCFGRTETLRNAIIDFPIGVTRLEVFEKSVDHCA